ncbi:MAG: hypothetical protein KGZ40_02815 [Clostridiales bacterium]|nr:hypothetical protein [Clostridiales bacterium]
MGVQSYLEVHPVFSLDEFRSELGESQTHYNLLMRATRRGLVDRVVRGVYVSRAGQYASVEPDPFVVATKLAPDTTLVYHSALEAHGLAHSPWRRVQFTTTRRVRRFAYRGFSYERYDLPSPLKPEGDVRFTTLLRRPGGVVRVSSRERTLVDAVNRSDLCGGPEEVFRSLASLPFVDSSNVIEYLRALGTSTAVARVGLVLEQRARDWYVAEDDLVVMRDMLGPGPYYFTGKSETGRWVATWKLYLPSDAADYEIWLNG